ncbi:MAG: Ig-like domain-containing protein, partial [Lachnospiraceae bacterium]|nr:Ig-like domain-containing protein [Lachnospiraceae bacterium]
TTASVGLPAGDYILLLTEYYWSDATYRFTVNYTKSDAWEKERNETVTTPNDILTNKEYSGSIMESNDKDYYRFSLEKAATVSFTFSHVFVDKNDRYWKLRLYSADEVTNVLFEQEFRGNEKKAITTGKIKLSAGTYIILLTEYYWSDVTYRFTVNDASSGKPKKESNPTDVIPGGGGATDPQPLLTMDKEQSIVLVKGQKFMMADSGWKTAAKKVVSVSKKTVKAKAEGETDLTLGEYSIHAKVVSVEQTKNEKNMELEAGTSGMISLGGIKAGDGTIVIGGEKLPVCFMTSAPDVALVDDSGSVTAVAAGTATITAYINGVAFKCKVKVSESTAKLQRTLHVNLGKSKSIKIKGLNKAEWVPAEEDIVKIKKNKITGLHAGTTTLSYGEYTVDVIVEDPSIEGSSKPYAQTLNMKVKTEETITLKKVDQPVFFKSSKPHIAWMDEDGVIHARSKGTAKLTAKINGKSVKITVKVD